MAYKKDTLTTQELIAFLEDPEVCGDARSALLALEDGEWLSALDLPSNFGERLAIVVAAYEYFLLQSKKLAN